MKAIPQIARHLILCTLFFVSYGELIAQKTYATRQGMILIKAIKGDSLSSFKFNNITVVLDYEKASVDIIFKAEESSNDIARSSRPFSDGDLKITAQLSIPKIETQPHPDWNFQTSGKLILQEKVYFVSGNGELKHHEGGESLACYLMLKFEPASDSNHVIEPFGEIQELHLFQTILSQQSLDEFYKGGY